MQPTDLVSIVTDVLLAAVSFWVALQLLPTMRHLREHAISYWVAALCSVGASAALGGIWHGFAPALEPRTAALIWTSTIALAIAGSFMFLIATLHVFTSGRLLGLLSGGAVIKFVLFAVWANVNHDLRLVIYDAGLTMLIMLLLASWGAWLQRVPAASWILAGVVTAMVAALFLQGRVSLHRYFNHNDLYHVIQVGALYCLYRAGTMVRDKDPQVLDFEATQPLPVVGEE
jgi:uncharacterized protein DUF6962